MEGSYANVYRTLDARSRVGPGFPQFVSWPAVGVDSSSFGLYGIVFAAIPIPLPLELTKMFDVVVA